jgi:hypothetical protein
MWIGDKEIGSLLKNTPSDYHKKVASLKWGLVLFEVVLNGFINKPLALPTIAKYRGGGVMNLKSPF